MDALGEFIADIRWIERNCWILTKQGQIVPLRLNATQHKIVNAALEQLHLGRPVRLVILKCRQHGCSTLVMALAFARTARREGVRSLLLSHQDDSKQKIWSMTGRFLRYSGRDAYQRSFAESDGPLAWHHESVMSCHTAGGKFVGHGETINFAHFSEVARYGEGMNEDQQAQAKKSFYEVRAALANTPDSCVFIESTANGIGGLFHDEYWRAAEGKSEYAAVFIPWFEHHEYVLDPLRAGITGQDSCTAGERELGERFGLSLEQLAWRRHTIANDFGGDERLFREQYPATDTEAFLVSGAPVYDPERIGHYLRQARGRQPLWRGDLLFEPPSGWILQEEEQGPLKVWDWPRADRSYVIGADSAECLDTKSDRDAAVVRSGPDADVAATLAGHWEPGEYARKLAALGFYYHGALLVPERNNTGHAVVMVLRDLDYGNLYRFDRLDKATGQRQKVYGFPTDMRTKHAAVEAEMELLRSGAADYPDAELLREMTTFVHQAGRKMGAQSGCHDDLVIASAIAALAARELDSPERDDERGEDEIMEEKLNAISRGEPVEL